MGDVAITIAVKPSSMEVDLNVVIAKIRKLATIKDAKIEPIAFGLKQVKVLIVKPDASGGTQDLEAKIREIEGVGDVEVESVTLL